jgi:uncharacterized Zn finger protein (UPF0148 family)
MTRGFYLRKLQLQGAEVQEAEIDFFPGLNVITGPSDTGKSYIFQCIDYMLGGSTPPKSIDESSGYSQIRLEVGKYSGDIYTLERDMVGGGFLCYEHSIEDLKDASQIKESQPLLPKHNDKNENNISSFLLMLAGIDENVKIRKNTYFETENLTFRTMSHFFFVDEESIIQEDSPVYGKSDFKRTVQKWAFHYLLTGENDNNLISIARPNISEAREAARTLAFDQIILDLENENKLLAEQAEKIDVDFDNLEDMIVEQTNLVTSSSSKITSLQKERQPHWDEKQKVDSRKITIDELLLRFSLLKEHYESDIQRLEFMSEGEFYFQQLETVYCPLCGSCLDDHESKQRCIDNDGVLIDIQTAAEQESRKIRKQMRDLENTFSTLEDERKELLETSAQLQKEISNIDETINDFLAPQLIAEKSKLDSLLDKMKILDQVEINAQRLQKLWVLRANNSEKTEKTPEKNKAKDELNTVALRKLSTSIEQLIKSWKYIDSGVVEFSENKLDILIDGTPRKNHGKGVRALLRSAFNVGLMRFCAEYDRPHPRLVVLDSPLLNFKERSARDMREEISGEIKQAFFADLASTSDDEQIIVLENEPVPMYLEQKINLIEFVGPFREGRSGFFPS